jgi:predicted nucleotidyltransferase
MNEITERVLVEMIKAIVREVNHERIYLFGSRARGDERADSDVDLLIVEGEAFGRERSRRQEISRIRRTLSPFRIPTDILVYSTEETTKWQNSVNHVISRCLREGKLLYARS